MMRHHALHAPFSFFLLSVSVSIFLYFFFCIIADDDDDADLLSCNSIPLGLMSILHAIIHFCAIESSQDADFFSSEYVISSLALMQSH